MPAQDAEDGVQAAVEKRDDTLRNSSGARRKERRSDFPSAS
jgi:hypothetical protein